MEENQLLFLSATMLACSKAIVRALTENANPSKTDAIICEMADAVEKIAGKLDIGQKTI